MKKIILGKIEKVDLRDIWDTEDKDFTPWLAQEGNISQLGDVIGKDLEVIALFMAQVNRCQTGAVLCCCDGASITVGQNAHARFQQCQTVFAHGSACLFILNTDGFCFLE